VLAVLAAPLAAAPGPMAQRVKACIVCHGDQGRAGRDGYYPRIAGKPAGYLYEQLLAFRDGRRRYALMAHLLEPLSDAYLREMADHFAALDLPHDPPRATPVDAATQARGRELLWQGDPSRQLPACASPNFSLVEPADADDLFAYLRSLPAVRRPAPTHGLRFPYGLPVALTAWRWLHFAPASMAAAPVTGSDARVRRGAYLVGGLGHCSACHGARNAWGANGGAWDLRGGTMPGAGWLAPSLADPQAAGVAAWTADEAVALLTGGRNRHASVSGPMATVVAHSLQHLRADDAQAMVAFLRQLRAPPPAPRPAAAAPDAEVLRLGAAVYERHCTDCHGRAGDGVDGAGPALAGNRALALDSPANVARMVLGGGFGPSTAVVPRPLGMPPFATLLGDEEIAAVVTHVRWQHGGRASGLGAHEVNRLR
jgi:mono/diheme cytochrome c family protein